MKRQQPSGNKNRQKAKEVEAEKKKYAGSMFKYVQASTPVPTPLETQQIGCQSGGSESDPTSSSSNERTGPQEQADKIGKESLKGEKHEVQRRENENSNDESSYAKTVSSSSSSLSDFMYNDIGDWPLLVPDNIRIELVKKGSEAFQNKEGPFKAKERPGAEAKKLKGSSRQLNSGWFYINLPNNEKVLRRWLAYSKSKEQLFCFCCKLFADPNEPESKKSTFVTGFEKWWKLNPKIGEHEESSPHLTALEKWTELSARLRLNQTIDHARQKMIDNENKKWRDLLYRILDVTLFLAKQNLPFRGHRENAKSENKGNFLELIEFLSNYDPVLKEHLLTTASSEKITNTYLSPQLQNEFIDLLGQTVREHILRDIQAAKYFGILLDSTPDISHVDQMCEIIRYVHIENGKVEVRESFLDYFPLGKKDAGTLTNDILKNLEKNGLDIQMCRSQGYDNVNTMSGIHKGVQTRIKELNPKALYVPCANHSLNLCGVHSFATVVSSVTFFGALESIYTFFSVSTHRWDVLKEHVNITVKRVNETRWSAHHDAVKPVINQFTELVDAIEALTDPAENIDTRGSAQILLSNVCDFSFLCYLNFWHNILEEVNAAQKYLQIAGLSLEKCVVKLRYLLSFLRENRDELVDNAIRHATEMCQDMDISVERRGRRKKKKMMPGEEAEDAGLSLSQELRRAMFECLDRFCEELARRLSSLEYVSSKFAIVDAKNILYTSTEDLHDLASNLTEHFDELNTSSLVKEVIRLRRNLAAAQNRPEDCEKWTALQFLQFIVDFTLADSLPNVFLALKFFLTICVSVASCERSFSKLKLIKSFLRSTMTQLRLSNLAILSIEKGIATRISFDDVIKKFAEIKVRRVKF